MKTWQFIVLAVIGLMAVGALAAAGGRGRRKRCGCHRNKAVSADATE